MFIQKIQKIKKRKKGSDETKKKIDEMRKDETITSNNIAFDLSSTTACRHLEKTRMTVMASAF